MSATKQVMASVKFIIIAACVLTTTANDKNSQYIDTWVIDDWGCRTPDKGVGHCIPVRNCKPIIDVVSELQSSETLTQILMEFLRGYICGSEGNVVKVCCPFAPILVPKQPTVTVPPEIDNHRNLHLLSLDCGTISEDIRLFGGNKTGLFEFPWMALLSYDLGNGGTDFRCGGTIINSRYILTAAHCITDLSKLKLIGARLGEHDINSPTDCTKVDEDVTICAPPVQDIAIDKVIPHPDYNNKAFANDIGLIRLVLPIDTTKENAKPICLPITSALRNVNLSSHNFTVTGWGLIDQYHKSFDLLKVNVPAVTKEHCRKAYGNTNVIITSNHICAGSKTFDACKGDSGGPLQKIDFLNNDIRYVQYGVVSFGPKICGNTRAPGVYTKVDSYLHWILDNLRP